MSRGDLRGGAGVVATTNATTNATTLAGVTPTAAGLALLDDADAAAQRATLGVVIGTNVQAQDADLQALADNSTAGLWARTGAGTGAARTITGTANLITVTNGDGVSGNPTLTVGSDVYRVGGTDVALADGGTAASTALGAADSLGVRRVQVFTWYPVAVSSGLLGDITAAGTGTHGAGSTGGYFYASRSISATTGAYGWQQTTTHYWWVGGRSFTDVTLRISVTTNQRVYSGLLVSSFSGARTSGPAGIYFVFDQPTGDSTWKIQTSTGAERDATDTGVTVSTNTWYRLRQELTNSGATVNWSIWASASDPTMSGVTPTTGSVSPATIPTAQASGFEAALGQPSSSSTVQIDCYQAQAGQLP